ncbi:MAG: histidine triad nucleotide-binding protein [bacterium]
MSCIFCRIIAKEIPARVIREDAEWLAFEDVQPQAPHHVLLVPRRHIGGLPDCGTPEQSLLGALLSGAAEVARARGIEERGYRVVINSGVDGGQSVAHLHVHLLAGRPMKWPPG